MENDMTLSNTLSYSPSTIVEEAEAMLDMGYSEEDTAVLRWITEKATKDDLDLIASYILNGDYIWEVWKNELWEAMRQIHKEVTK